MLPLTSDPNLGSMDRFEKLTLEAQACVKNTRANLQKLNTGEWVSSTEKTYWPESLYKISLELLELANSQETVLAASQIISFEASVTTLHSRNTKNFMESLFTKRNEADTQAERTWSMFSNAIRLHKEQTSRLDPEKLASAMFDLVRHNEEVKFAEFYHRSMENANPATLRTLKTAVRNIREMFPDVGWLKQYSHTIAEAKKVEGDPTHSEL